MTEPPLQPSCRHSGHRVAARVSDGLSAAYLAAAGLTLAAVLLFHVWQNFFAARGGVIAFPKSLWLGLTVFCWLLLPPLLLRRSKDRRARLVWRVFWLGMLARAAAEMWLLYGLHRWQYAYGIVHDLISAAWLAWGVYYCRRTLPEVRHMGVMAAMFVAETAFAYYISHFNLERTRAELWFIGWERAHLPNLMLTCLLEILLLAWLGYLYRSLFYSRLKTE